MKLGHLILILSLGIIIAGIMLMGISGINASHPFLYQNMLVTNGLLKSKETKSEHFKGRSDEYSSECNS